MPTLRVDGTELHYSRDGERGPAVLMVMGMAGRGAGWRPLVERLRQDHQLVFFDNRGIGKSEAGVGGLSMQGMATDTLALLDHLGWGQAHVVGVSMGGMIAQELALMATERVRSLSLLATTAHGADSTRLRLSLALTMARSVWGTRNSRLRALAEMLYSETFRAEIDIEELNRELSSRFGRAPLITLMAQRRAITGHDTRERLYKLSALPALIVRPGRDRLIDPVQSDRIKQLMPHAELMDLPNAGHAVFVEQADKVATAIRKLISQAESQEL